MKKLFFITLFINLVLIACANENDSIEIETNTELNHSDSKLNTNNLPPDSILELEEVVSNPVDIKNDYRLPSDTVVLPGHLIPDSLSAVKIAEIICSNYFWKGITNQKPYEIKLEMKNKDTIWHINGTLTQSIKTGRIRTATLGSVFHILIKSKNCEVVEIYKK